MKKLTFFLSILALLLISSCTARHQIARTFDLPCHDGWLRDSNGESHVWQPSPDELNQLKKLMPQNRKYDCYHRQPNGVITIPNIDFENRTFANTFKTSETGFVFVKEEVLGIAK